MQVEGGIPRVDFGLGEKVAKRGDRPEIRFLHTKMNE